MKRLILTVLYVFLYLGMQAAASFPFRHIGIRDGLPDNYVKNVFGQDEKEFYQEINPILNTDTRISGITSASFEALLLSNRVTSSRIG